MTIEERFQDAVQSYWNRRKLGKGEDLGALSSNSRPHFAMEALEFLVFDILYEAGLKLNVQTRAAVELPGYYRSEKKWDLVVLAENRLVLAMDFKAQVGVPFGNTLSSRVSEAVGSAADFWLAYREKRLGSGPRPFLGYFLLLEDCHKMHDPVRNRGTHFRVDPSFDDSSYSKRYELLCQRLVLERSYSAVCLVVATNSPTTTIAQSIESLSFMHLVSDLREHVHGFIDRL